MTLLNDYRINHKLVLP